MIVNELVTKFKFDTGKGFRKFDTQLKKAAKNTTRTTKAMGRAFGRMAKRSAKSVSNIGKSLSKVGKEALMVGKGMRAALRQRIKIAGTGKAKKELALLKGMAMSLKTAMKGFALGGAVAGVATLGAAFARTLKVGAETEQLLAGLSTLRGPQQAKRDMKDLQTMAASTPFKVNELTESFMRLNASGFKVDLKSLKKLGDLAAGTTGKSMKDLTEVLIKTGRGSAELVDNFNGMSATSKAGVLNIQSLDSKTGKLSKTFIKAGDKAALLEFYLKAATEQDTAGAMERLSKTAKGLASTLADNIDLALLAFYNSMQGSLKGLYTWFIKVAQKIQPLARDFGVFVKLNLPTMINKMTFAFKVLGPAIASAAAAYLLFKGYLISSAIAETSMKVLRAAKAFMALSTAARVAGISAMVAQAQFALIPAAIAAVIAIVGLLAYDFYNFFTTGSSALLDFLKPWPQLHAIIETAYLMFIAFGMSIGPWVSMFVSALTTVIGWFGSFLGAILGVVGKVLAAFVMMAANIITGLMRVVAAAIEAGPQIGSAIMGAFSSIGSWLLGLPSMAITAFSGLLSAAKNAASKIPVIGGMFGGGAPVKRNKGGFIPGTGNTDTVPVVATPGEFMITKGLTQKIMNGDPAGLKGLQRQMNAPSMATVGSSNMSGGAGTQSVASSAVASNNYNITINAPMTQTNNINGMGSSPNDVGNKIGASASSRFNKGLSDAARQVPKRVSRSL